MADAKNDKKPADTPFKQQRLAAWQPIMSPLYVVGCFLFIAVAFIPIGVVVVIASGEIVEVEAKYSDPVCTWGASTFVRDDNNIPASPGAAVNPFGTNFSKSVGCSKTVSLKVDRAMKAPVYLYYKLTNFYQNHRRYANSRVDSQIAGLTNDVGSECDPIKGFTTETGAVTYSPCGLIAWSMFNDSAKLFQVNTDNTRTLICNTEGFYADGTPNVTAAGSCVKIGIAWDSDRDKKFQPPKNLNDNILTGNGIKSSRNYFARNGYYNNEAGHRVPLVTDEDTMVWFRTASLPNFRKLWRKINKDLPVGSYEIEVTDRFDTSAFSGKKSIVLATTSWIGGKNEFLGVAYIVVGALCFVLSVGFFVKHKISGDRPSGVDIFAKN